LNDSITALSVGFPGLLKSSFTPLNYAQRSKLCEMNSGPLSTRIDFGLPRCAVTRSKTRTTSSPVSRETELMRHYRAHEVHAWMGSSREVAEDHYLMVIDDDYRHAANAVAKDPLTKAVQSATAANCQQPSPENEPAVSPAIAKDTAVQIPPRGVEPRFSD
jgi:hypothetical protein